MLGLKKRNATMPQGVVVLSDFSEGGVLAVLAYTYPQRAAGGEFLAPIYDAVVAALRADLVRRWANRGGPVAIEFPDRLPALAIEAGVHFFRTLADMLTASPENEAAMRAAGASMSENARTIADGQRLCKAIADLVSNSRVEVGATLRG